MQHSSLAPFNEGVDSRRDKRPRLQVSKRQPPWHRVLLHTSFGTADPTWLGAGEQAIANTTPTVEVRSSRSRRPGRSRSSGAAFRLVPYGWLRAALAAMVAMPASQTAPLTRREVLRSPDARSRTAATPGNSFAGVTLRCNGGAFADADPRHHVSLRRRKERPRSQAIARERIGHPMSTFSFLLAGNVVLLKRAGTGCGQ